MSRNNGWHPPSMDVSTDDESVDGLMGCVLKVSVMALVCVLMWAAIIWVIVTAGRWVW